MLPGVVAVVGGLLLVRSRNRATAMLGGWLSVVAGAWFVVGRVMATTLTIGEIGRPVAENDIKAAWLELTYFYGLGALIIFLGAMGWDGCRCAACATSGTPSAWPPIASSTSTWRSADHGVPGDRADVDQPDVPPGGNLPRRSWRDRFKRRGQKDTLVGR